MKLEFRCPTCDKGYLIDQASAEGNIPCPGCGGIIGLEVGDDDAEQIDRPAAPAAAEGKQIQPVAIAAGAPTTKAVAPTPEEVVCPRCKLHFSPRRAETQPKSKSRPVVLVVEDMSYFREVAAEALSGEYEVKLAGTLDGARSILAHGGIDLLVLDLTMDGGDHGVDLLRELPYKPCPILIYTAQDENEMYGESWDELQKLGADDIIIKGMNVSESLLRKVGTLLGKSWDDED
jgi:CheY-like chemotaxis protein